MDYQITKLDSGLQVVTANMPHMESVTSGILVACGGRYEDVSMSGISHFLEHMLFKGTQKRKSREISESIEGIGGALNAYTSEENTCYFNKVPKKHFALGLEVLADMYLNSTFLEEEIEKEKGVVKEEIKMYLDLPSQYVHDILGNVLWPDHSLGRLLLGTEKIIDRITQADFFNYKNQHYVANKTVVAVAGDIRHEEVVEEVKKLFDKLPAGEHSVFDPALDIQTKPEHIIFKKDTEQAHLCLGIRALPREHPDRYILRVMNTLLGANMSSRLFQEVREKHSLAYEIHSSINRYQDTGSFVVSAGVEVKKLDDAVEIVLKELKKLTLDAVNADELQRAKDYIEGQIMMSLEKTMNCMLNAGESLLETGKVLSKEEVIANIHKVKTDDIIRVANDLFIDKKLNLAVIGPISDQKSLLQRLTFK